MIVDLARLANVKVPPMRDLPQRRLRVYRFKGGNSIRYRLRVSKNSYGTIDWQLRFKTAAGMAISIKFDRHHCPTSIKVNGFTWVWRTTRGSRRTYRWVPDAQGLSNGLPDKVANVVNVALQELQVFTEQTSAALMAEQHRATRLAIERADRRHEQITTRNQRHLKEVLQKV